MKVGVQLGGDSRFDLQKAILIYGGDAQASGGKFATVHDVKPAPDGGAPYLAEGQPLKMDFLTSLAKDMGRSIAPEILPANILVRTPDVIVWWTGFRRRQMFFNAGSGCRSLNGGLYPHPPLVWKLEGHQLYVRALGRPNGVRPLDGNRLKVAPYMNVSEDGRVCLGSMKVPATTTIDNYEKWEQGFYSSEFTHANAPRLFKAWERTYLALWESLRHTIDFPDEVLVDAKQTLRQFVIGDGK